MQFAYDLNDGRWMRTVYPDCPVKIKPDLDGTLDFLTGSLLFKVSLSADRFNNGNVPMYWKSNDIQILKNDKGFGYEVLLHGIIVEYDSDIPIIMYLYLNDNTVASPPQGTTLNPSFNRSSVQAPLGRSCKTLSVKFSSVLSDANQQMKIKSLEIYYEEMYSGGELLTT